MVTRWRWPPESWAGRWAGPIGQMNQIQGVHSPLPCLFGGDAADQQRHFNVFDGAEHRQQVIELENETHGAGTKLGFGVVREAGDVNAANLDHASRDVIDAAQTVEQGGLAAAGGAHDRYHVGLGHGKRDASQRLDLESIRLVGFDQIDGFHGRRLGLIL